MPIAPIIAVALSFAVDTSCDVKLNQLCASARLKSSSACKACVFDNLANIEAAGCSHADEDAFCNATPPPVPPPPPVVAAIPDKVAAFAKSHSKTLINNITKAICCTSMPRVQHDCDYPNDNWSPDCPARRKEARDLEGGAHYSPTCYARMADWVDRNDPCIRCGECVAYRTDHDYRVKAFAQFCTSDGTRSITVAYSDSDCLSPLGTEPMGKSPHWDTFKYSYGKQDTYPALYETCEDDTRACSKDEPQGHCGGVCDGSYPNCKPICDHGHCSKCTNVAGPSPETLSVGGFQFLSIKQCSASAAGCPGPKCLCK